MLSRSLASGEVWSCFPLTVTLVAQPRDCCPWTGLQQDTLFLMLA